MSAILELVSNSPCVDKAQWINEANFGARYVDRYCNALNPGASVLEVGCGSGILLGILKESHPRLRFEGIEPFNDGFAELKPLTRLLQSHDTTIHATGYERFTPDCHYELIYSVNVFEHLDNWRDFLGFVERYLSRNGVCVILCPNYTIPYESHFRLPILFNKHVTETVFRGYITRFERDNRCQGLWKSLNFVKLGQVKRAVRSRCLNLHINHQITNDMIERLSTDAEFRARQCVMGTVGTLVKSLGLTTLLRWKLFENIQPYMMLELRRRP